MAGLGLSLCADLLEDLKSSRKSDMTAGVDLDDTATQEALQRHEVFERNRVSF